MSIDQARLFLWIRQGPDNSKPMALPEPLFKFLTESAQREGINEFSPEDDLFRLGVLDSFTLVDFVTLIEDHYEISVKDSDVIETNFQTVKAIEDFIIQIKRALR